MTQLPPCVELGPADAEYSIIWLHGLGADGHDFEPIVPELDLKEKIRYIFPHAPVRPVTINAGIEMRAWYDISAEDFSRNEDEAGIRNSQALLETLIEREVQRGINSKHIVLAGFSQGGAIVLHTGLRYADRLGGIMALSSYLPLVNRVASEKSAGNATTPIFLAHGTHDSIVPITWAEDTRYYLENHDYPLEWHTYYMEHSVHPDEIADIRNWIRSIFHFS